MSGLGITRRITVDRHQGDIRVESETGTMRFQMWLPITDPGDAPGST